MEKVDYFFAGFKCLCIWWKGNLGVSVTALPPGRGLDKFDDREADIVATASVSCNVFNSIE
jgi:hypothetical protein